MLKVECEACKAPYQIDERRVPPAGLKMRCPKCGHSFAVVNPGAAASPAPKIEPPRPRVPSDFPAALGSLDEADLPVVSAPLPIAKTAGDALLPAAKKSPPRPPPAKPAHPPAPANSVPRAPETPTPAYGDIDLDLPAVLADLPAARISTPKATPPRGAPSAASETDNLPVPVGQGVVDLPVVSAHLPAIGAALPAVAAQLPATANQVKRSPSPPVVHAAPNGFGEVDLPASADVLPVVVARDHHLPARPPRSDAPSGIESFGEIELPSETAFGEPPAPAGSGLATADAFAKSAAASGDPQLDNPRGPSARSDPNRDGGMTFGELDLSSPQDGSPQDAISIMQAPPRGEDSINAPVDRARDAPSPNGGWQTAQAASTAPVRAAAAPAAPGKSVPPRRKPSMKSRLAFGAIAMAVVGGAALQLTPAGAFGYLTLTDRLRATDYSRATSDAVSATEKVLASDTYDDAKAAIESAAALHARVPRARSLTAYAALVDSATAVRFGPDTSRASRAKQLLAELLPEDRVKYRDVAMAAQAAENDDFEKARSAIDAAASADPADPIQVDVALLQGNIALAVNDGAAAITAFQRALARSDDARAHFGLARAYDRIGDAPNAKKEIAAVLAVSPQHPGALTLRARMASAPADEAQALQDLSVVIEGPARAKAAPNEISSAYAARAWLRLERGSGADAREAFAQAVKINPRNVAALRGEGRLLLGEGRYTEALARFDTAVQAAPGSPDAIADDAEARLALDRPAEAKQQLTDARARFPKSLSILLLLGRVEQHLGNNAAAETDMRAAIAMSDPSRRDAVLPYVALSELLSSQGRAADARAVLDEAKAKLAASAALDRAVGEVAELQGEHDIAISQYKAAIARDPRDAAAHFRLAVTLRRVRRFDEARAELEKVATFAGDYPGLALERGLLFEESGDVARAIDEFKAALARAPDDPDLQLRVGSAYVAIGRPDDAIPMLRKVLAERPASADAHHYLGRALMLKGPAQQAEALRFLKRAVDLDRNRVEFHVYLAWAANEAVPPQVDLASEEIETALSLDKLNAETYWQKGVLERMQGAIEDAIKDEKRALELRPSRYEAHATLAECYEERNDVGTAMVEWAKAIAGDGDAPADGGGVRHPYWRYKYAKLLMERSKAAAALPLLVAAAAAVEKAEPRPGWAPGLEFLTAEALAKTGRKTDAVDHYRRFLDTAPASSPDRADAQAALRRITGAR